MEEKRLNDADFNMRKQFYEESKERAMGEKQKINKEKEKPCKWCSTLPFPHVKIHCKCLACGRKV